MCKAEMLKEYFSVEIDKSGNLCTLPVVLDQYTPDMERLPRFVLNLGNDVRGHLIFVFDIPVFCFMRKIKNFDLCTSLRNRLLT